jgi:hypothetical protein
MGRVTQTPDSAQNGTRKGCKLDFQGDPEGALADAGCVKRVNAGRKVERSRPVGGLLQRSHQLFSAGKIRVVNKRPRVTLHC